MSDKAPGFSLIEALITLVVLSVGLLGLGQLQVQLWRASSARHMQADALLSTENHLEKYRISTANHPRQVTGNPPPTPSGGRLSTRLTARKIGNTSNIQSLTLWSDGHAKHRMQMDTSVIMHNRDDRHRWLLSPPSLWSLPPSH